MESLIYRYRNITVLLVAVFAQLILLAWQIKSENDVPLVRMWAVTAVTPVASAIENARNGTTGFIGSYFALRDERAQSHRLQSELDRLRLENQLLKNELESAQRAEALAGFQTRTLSKMVGARVIGTTSGPGSRSILIDRGATSGVRKGMAVVTPAGIVGKVLSVYPFASQVLSVSDPGFAAGVVSQKNHVRGVLKGLGGGAVKVDYIAPGQKVEVGEVFYTSGDDRVFPKGLPAGRVTGVKDGNNYLDVFVQPSGTEAAPEEVLVIVDPVHQEIPEAAASDSAVFLAPPPPPDNQAGAAQPGDAARGDDGVPSGSGRGTQADKLLEQYKKLGEERHITYGEGAPGSAPPNFNPAPQAPAPTAAPKPAAPRQP